MFAIGIRYLCGWSMSTDPADRLRPEWPPHPDRVFMALAAAHFATDGDGEERAALEWLESQGAPSLAVSGAAQRTTVTAYVPVNDSAAPRLPRDRAISAEQVSNGLALLPANRPRQARNFPTAVPADPVVHVLWPSAKPSVPVLRALEALCRKVTHLGHSASLTQVWIEEEPPRETIWPDDTATAKRLRVPNDGRLEDLARRFASGMRPRQALWHGYNETSKEIPHADPAHGIFSEDIIILRMIGRRLGLESTSHVLDTLRGALLQRAEQPPPQWLSGHHPDGTPSTEPHMAMVALPDVGHKHADGHLLGVALALPRTVDAAEVGRVLRTVFLDASGSAGFRLYNGRLLDVTLRLDMGAEIPRALRAETWCSDVGARLWSSVTPVVLDRFPKRDGDAERIIALACERIGLPSPAEVIVTGVSRLSGVPPAMQFARWIRGSGPPRIHRHVTIAFDRPVIGPVIVGAGRFRGYGLCRPIPADRARQ